MIRNFTLTNALGASFSLMNAQQGAFFEPQGLGYDDVTQYEQVGEFFAPLTQRYGQQVVTGTMVFGSQPYEHYLAFTKFCQHAPLSLVYETDAGTFQIPCRLTKIEKGDTDGWTYLNCKVEFTALARMYKTVTANNTGTAGGGKVYLAKDWPDITGSIITIDNAEAGEVLNITADINAVQSGSGTPSPTNVRPISGHDDVVVSVASGQLIDTSTNESGAIDASGNEVANASFNRTQLIPISKGTVFFKSDVQSGYTIRIHGYNNGTWVQQLKAVSTSVGYETEITVPSTVNQIRISYPTYGVDNTYLYEGNTYTTALGRTVYGGTLDLVSGLLTVAYASYVVDENQSFTNNISSQNRVYFQLADMERGTYNTDDMVKCNAFPKSTASGTPANTPNIAIGANSNYIYIQGVTGISGVTDINSFKTWLSNNNVVFTYKLATPQIYQLTPQQIQTLLGQNNVWANSGDITITGRKTYGYKYNYTYGDFVADTVTIDSDSTTSSPCRITIFGECTQPTWRHYLDGNSVATGYYNGTIPSGHKLVIDTTSSPYSIEEQDIAGNLIADRYELCDFSTERFFLLEYGHNTVSVSHTDPESIRLMVEGYIFYETV